MYSYKDIKEDLEVLFRDTIELKAVELLLVKGRGAFSPDVNKLKESIEQGFEFYGIATIERGKGFFSKYKGIRTLDSNDETQIKIIHFDEFDILQSGVRLSLRGYLIRKK